MTGLPITSLLRSFLTVLIAFSLSACDLSESGQTGRLLVKLTDTPAAYDAVWVDVQSVGVLQSRSTAADSERGNRQAEEDGWITVMDQPRRINLLTLVNGNELTLGNADLAPGKYSRLRFILGSDNEIVINGRNHPLMTPGLQQIETRLNIDATIEEGQTYTLLVDFDATRSVVETDNERFILNPVLRTADLSATGSITGSVSPADISSNVLAVSGKDTLSTLTGESGEFTIHGVAAGRYKIVYRPIGDRYDDATISEVHVGPGEILGLEPMNLQPSY